MKAYGIGLTDEEPKVVNRSLIIRSIRLSPGNVAVQIDVPTFVIDRVIVSMTAGTFNLWFGNYTGDNLPLVPHLHYTSIGQPVEIWLPGLGKTVKTITVGAEGPVDPCLGTIILMGERE